jgi:hypothetical protein
VHTEPFSKGYLHYIATERETRPWQNPYKAGLIDVFPSSKSPVDAYGCIAHVVEHSLSKGKFFTSYEQKNPKHVWVTIGLKDNRPIAPNYFSLRSAEDDGTNFALRNWKLQGSIDNKTWTTLSKHINDTSLSGSGNGNSWPILGCNTYYQYFRIQATGHQENPGHVMLGIGGFEIYGYVRM